MKRPHRAVHRLVWPVLALAVVLGFTLALVWRPPIPIETGSSLGSSQ